jgi:YGGT family
MEERRTERIGTTPHREVVETTERDTEVVHSTPNVTEVTSTAGPHAAVDRTEAVAYDPYEHRRLFAHRAQQLIYWVFGLIEGLLAIRFVLKALGANPSAGFAQFIYGITDILVAPFAGLFGTPRASGSVLELNSIVAMIVYALLAWLLAKLVWILAGETRSAVTTRSTSFDSHN